MVGIMVGGLSISHLYCPVSQTNGYGSRYKVIYAFLNLYIFVFFARKSADLSLFTRKKCGKKLAPAHKWHVCGHNRHELNVCF
jgi:hypothetical protein